MTERREEMLNLKLEQCRGTGLFDKFRFILSRGAKKGTRVMAQSAPSPTKEIQQLSWLT
jgi:hypothetical protein